MTSQTFKGGIMFIDDCIVNFTPEVDIYKFARLLGLGKQSILQGAAKELAIATLSSIFPTTTITTKQDLLNKPLSIDGYYEVAR